MRPGFRRRMIILPEWIVGRGIGSTISKDLPLYISMLANPCAIAEIADSEYV